MAVVAREGLLGPGRGKLVDESDHLVAGHAVAGVDKAYLHRHVAEIVGCPVNIPEDFAGLLGVRSRLA